VVKARERFPRSRTEGIDSGRFAVGVDLAHEAGATAQNAVSRLRGVTTRTQHAGQTVPPGYR
jgi:hypothetical protein